MQLVRSDILHFAERHHGAPFDHIECGGVLHHMPDPARALAKLAGMLRPGGSLHLSVYSSRADDITKMPLRRLARWRGALASDAGIRQFRRDIQHTPSFVRASWWRTGSSGLPYAGGRDVLCAGAPDAAACAADAAAAREGWGGVQDVFSISGVRDLVFHEHERGYTVAQVAALLAGAGGGLLFRGVNVDDATLRRFKRGFPQELSERSLANWEQFEQQNPLTFSSMIGFWAQKPAAAG